MASSSRFRFVAQRDAMQCGVACLCMVCNALGKCLSLDEATNSLDAANERAIVENLAGFYRGRTVVVVAHRLSTVREADSIIVMDSGRVAESGTHSELVSRKGVYYNLVRNQLELGN